MSETITSQSQIPDAPYYVLANDSFLSNWGTAAGKTNTVILPCKSYDEAEIVAANAKARSEMRRVRIAYLKPKLSSHIIYSLTFGGVWLDLGCELEEQAEFADFHRLFHEVYAEEIVQDDA